MWLGGAGHRRLGRAGRPREGIGAEVGSRVRLGRRFGSFQEARSGNRVPRGSEAGGPGRVVALRGQG